MGLNSDPFDRLRLIREMPTPLPIEEQARLSVKDVKAGGYIQIEEKTYRVDRVNRYASGQWEWFELQLTCLQTGETEYLEWEEDDVLEISVREKGLSLTDISVTSAMLADFDSVEDGQIRFQGQIFRYDESDEAQFFRDNGDENESVYYWDFEGPNGLCLGVEKWGSEYEVHLMRKLTTKIQILNQGGSDA